MISLNNAKDLFPQLKKKINGCPLLYLDTAASALKPISVIECINNLYKFEASNVHRAAHFLSNQATQKYEDSRVKVKNFIGAAHENEIVFTSGTTDSINLVAQSWGRVHLGENDEIIISEMEHHSNIVPWLLLQKEKKFKINWLTFDQAGEINLAELKNLLNSNTKLLSLTHCSNVLGTVNPIQECISLAHSVGASVLIDAAQSVSFASIN
ncbi:MAG: aminotransferase class V-fold PLP-dependent enzyme, partial [Bdellovibrionales bacterium]